MKKNKCFIYIKHIVVLNFFSDVEESWLMAFNTPYAYYMCERNTGKCGSYSEQFSPRMNMANLYHGNTLSTSTRNSGHSQCCSYQPINLPSNYASNTPINRHNTAFE